MTCALNYIGRKDESVFRVFPVTIIPDPNKPGSFLKLPLISSWYERATTDPTIINGWQQEFGSRFTHFGIPTGDANDIMAFDFDFKGGADPVKSCADQGLIFPPTLSQRTMSGGFHLIYRIPKGLKVGNTAGSIVPGLDTRGQKGYIVQYALDFNTPITDVPDWFIQGLKKEQVQTIGNNYIIAPSLARTMLEEICATVASAPPQESNNTLNVCAYTAARDLIGTGSLPKELVYEQLMIAAKQRGKSDREAQATIESGFAGGLKDAPSVVCPFEPTPVRNMVLTSGWCPPKPTIDQFFDFTHLRRPQNFKDWSPRDITLFTADGGSGKTTLLVNEAICLALGVPFAGFQCVEAGKTLFITGEDSSEKIYASMGKVMTDMGLTREQMEIVADSIRVKKETDMTVITKDRNNYLVPNHLAFQSIQHAITEMRPRMIVIDPIDMFWGSEAGLNDMSKAVAKFAMMLRDEADAQIVIVNHMGKQSSAEKDLTQFAGRGGSGLPSHARVVRTMMKMKDEEYTEMTGKPLGPDQYGMKLVTSKFSDYSPILDELMIFTRTGHVVERSTVIRTQEADKDDRHDTEKLLELIKEFTKRGTPVNEPAMISMLGLSKAKVVQALNHLTLSPPDGYLIKKMPNPDVLEKGMVYVITDRDGFELK